MLYAGWIPAEEENMWGTYLPERVPFPAVVPHDSECVFGKATTLSCAVQSAEACAARDRDDVCAQIVEGGYKNSSPPSYEPLPEMRIFKVTEVESLEGTLLCSDVKNKPLSALIECAKKRKATLLLWTLIKMNLPHPVTNKREWAWWGWYYDVKWSDAKGQWMITDWASFQPH
uniref:Uncharacterized protein n=1 Tax=Magnetococcus massalia (strain MO-1) TaxID=451514 RepID=A0A1S7LI27_MAGMO|nr:protein of unknown function [Candidatus Magnetococcus massalia]